MCDLQQTILIVDDAVAIVEVLETYLRDEGFRVLRALDGEAAVDLALRERPHLILLDLILPKLPGLTVLREVRRHRDIPVIMVTGCDGEVDRVVGLELGADDYVSKPFSPREVVARVKSVLCRRMPQVAGASYVIKQAAHDVQRIGDLTIDRTAHEVTRKGHAIGLTPREFCLVGVFADHPGQAFTRDRMIDLISKDGSEVFDRTIDRHIANLRAKIEVDTQRPRYILTVPGIGYRMMNVI
jgi:DNA-binding response OmpR family regulator